MYPVRYVGEIYFECSVKIMYIYTYVNYTLEKTEGPIQTALATLGTPDTERRQTKHKTQRRKRYLGE